MKNQLARATELLSRLSPDLFYLISIHEASISLQGKYSSTTIMALKEIGFPNDSFIISDINNYVTASFDNIKVTLTE